MRCGLDRQDYKIPCGRPKPSIFFHSSGLSWSFSAAMFSSRCASDDVPGIGNMTGDFCSSHASASCTIDPSGRSLSLKTGASATETELRNYARDHLTHFKAPQKIHFIPELPKTATGKVQKYVLRGKPAISKQ